MEMSDSEAKRERRRNDSRRNTYSFIGNSTHARNSSVKWYYIQFVVFDEQETIL